MSQYHSVYRHIVKAIREGRLVEPFNSSMFKDACPGIAENTYKTFLSKHCRGNPSGTSELFERAARGMYRAIRPFRYGI